MAIHWFEAGSREKARVGGKGACLMEMRAAGFPVPPGFCISVDAYEQFAAGMDLASLVTSLCAAPDLHTPAGAASAAAPVCDHLQSATLPAGLRSQIDGAYRSLCERAGGQPLVAARSSAVSEDGAVASFAGLYETYLNLADSESVLSAVLNCYRALWEPRAVQYRAAKGLDHAAERMAVVVMEMVPAEVAGVAFSVNPITGNHDEVLINASWGLGESVVSGQVTPDNVVAAKADGAPTTYDVGEKAMEIVLDPESGCGTVERPVAPERAARRCLSDDDVRTIVDMVQRAEQHYGRPQDIEFAYANSTWYLLQARPITALG